MDESEESSCMDARRTEACAAPSNVDTSRDFSFIISKRAAWGGGLRCQTFSFVPFSLFSRLRAVLATVQSRFIRVGNQYDTCEKQQQQHITGTPQLDHLVFQKTPIS